MSDSHDFKCWAERDLILRRRRRLSPTREEAELWALEQGIDVGEATVKAVGTHWVWR